MAHVILGGFLLSSFLSPARAVHTFTFINNCDIPVQPVVRGVGQAPGQIQGGAQWQTTIPESWVGGRMWGMTDACPDGVNGAGCTLGECSLFTPGTLDPASGKPAHSQCNLSLASGMNAAATLTHGSETKHCTGFDDRDCFSTGNICASNSCLTDDPDVNSIITMTISGCLAQSMQYGQAGAPAGSSGGDSSSSGGSAGSSSSQTSVPVSGGGATSETGATSSVGAISAGSSSNAAVTSTTVASDPASAATQSSSNTPASQTPKWTGWNGGRPHGGPPRRRRRPVPSRPVHAS